MTRITTLAPFRGALILAGLLAACGGVPWQTLDFDTIAGAGEFPDHHGIVLESVCDATFGVDAGGPFHEETVRRRVRLLTEGARQANAYYSVQYDGQLDTLSDVAGRIVKPTGESIPVEEWSDHPASSQSGLHTTARLRIADLVEASPGDVVELRWRLKSYSAFLGHGWAFEGEWPTMLARLTLTLPPGAEVATSFVERGEYGIFEPTREDLPDGRSRLTWQRQKRPAALKTSTYAPPNRSRRASIRYSVRKLPGAGVKEGVLTSWEDYGAWYASLLEGTGDVTPRIESIAMEVLADAPKTPKERVARLYRHVQDTVRYVSIQLGMGGWRPTPADEVAEQGFGDCKDMASYLKTLLSVDGIDSDMVILGTRSSYLAETPGPNLRGHNHAILAVNLPDQPPHFLDVTCRTCGFDDLPWQDQGTQVLIADGAESRLVRTPTSPPDSNRVVRHYDIALSADGAASFRLVYEAAGHFAKGHRRTLFNLNQTEREQWLRRLPGGHGAVGTTATEIVGQKDFGAPLIVRIEGSFGRLAKGSASLWTLGVSNLIGPPMSRIAKSRARLPAHLGPPHATEVVARIALSDGMRVGSVPDPVVVESPFGRYELRYVMEEGVLVVTRTFRRTASVVPADNVPALRKFADAVRAHDRDTAVLTRN